MQPNTTTVKARDMRCHGCATAAAAAVRNVPGVSDVRVDLPNQTVTVTHAPGVARQALADSLTRAGFPAE